MRALTRFRWFPLALFLTVLMALTPAGCAVAEVSAQSLLSAGVEPGPVVQATQGANLTSLDSLRHIAASLEAEQTRPSDSALFDAMQADLKSLAWRVVDGKYRATARTGTVGTWETNVRDAVWRGLFATTQIEPPKRLDFAFPHASWAPPLPAPRRFNAVADQ